jgi:uncharacterized protein (TIGR03437 family)
MFLAVAMVCRAQSQPITVTSGADFGLGVPANGSIVTLFCVGLSGIDRVSVALGYPLPRELQGVRVTIGGRTAPLYAVAPVTTGAAQINAQVPLDAEVEGSNVSIRVEQGQTVLTATSQVRLDSPGEFFRVSTSEGIFQKANSGYALVTNTNPARSGDILVTYLTGLPAATPPVPAGEAAPFEPLSIVPQYSLPAGIEELSLLIDGLAVRPIFVGLAPGLAGVYQVNFTLPSVASPVAEIVLQRRSCRAAFGSCVNGGGSTRTTRSTAVRLPVN